MIPPEIRVENFISGLLLSSGRDLRGLPLLRYLA